MAQRRMFSKKIINSAKFLKMPVSTQCLYFHLGLNADDEGVAEAYNIMKMINATEDDLKILVVKEFVIVLNEDLVTYIVHWNEHNLIRSDRMVDSMYKNLLVKLTSVEYLEGNVTYEIESQMSTICPSNDGIGKDRLGKVKLGKEKYLEGVMLTSDEYQSLLTRYGSQDLLDKGVTLLNNYLQYSGKKYKSHYHVMIGWVHERVIKDEKSKGLGHDGNPKSDTNTKESPKRRYTTKDYL